MEEVHAVPDSQTSDCAAIAGAGYFVYEHVYADGTALRVYRRKMAQEWNSAVLNTRCEAPGLNRVRLRPRGNPSVFESHRRDRSSRRIDQQASHVWASLKSTSLHFSRGCSRRRTTSFCHNKRLQRFLIKQKPTAVGQDGHSSHYPRQPSKEPLDVVIAVYHVSELREFLCGILQATTLLQHLGIYRAHWDDANQAGSFGVWEKTSGLSVAAHSLIIWTLTQVATFYFYLGEDSPAVAKLDDYNETLDAFLHNYDHGEVVPDRSLEAESREAGAPWRDGEAAYSLQ